jgi:enterochelin esterase family protein
MPGWNSFEAFLKEALSTRGSRQELVDALLRERPQWPWVQGNKATFIYNQPAQTGVALNLDTIKGDPPFVPLRRLEDTALWYVTREFESDDLLDYLIVVDDPMTPLANDPNLASRIAGHWQADPLNPLRIQDGSQHVSVLRMGEARPFPDWTALAGVPRGQVYEHIFDSRQLSFSGRNLWVYTPPGYHTSSIEYPLLILHDGHWAAGPFQVPAIADALIKHNRLRPIIIAMLQSGTQAERNQEYISNDKHYLMLLTEVLPYMQAYYRVDAANLGVGGAAVGAIAAAHAALKNPAVFSSLILISPPLGKGSGEDLLGKYTARFDAAEVLPKRIFQAVGRYEARARFVRPAHALRDILGRRRETAYQYAEVGSGHGLVGFRSILPEALAWAFPSAAS